MSAALCARDAVAESLMWEASAHGWRLMALETIHLLHAAQRRERSLEAQLSALRVEVRRARGQSVIGSDNEPMCDVSQS